MGLAAKFMVGFDSITLMITVVIPTRNRAELLRNTLESLTEQTLSNTEFEILVIDNGSTDHTAQVTADFTCRLRNLLYFHEPEPGLHAGRHRGLREARGDILVYADDDIRGLPTWLEAVAENFTDPEVALLGGNNYPDFQGPVPGWLNKLWRRPAMGGQGLGALSILSLPEGRRVHDPNLVWGCNFAIRRQVLLDAGGFHPDGMPKELIRFRGDGESHVSWYLKQNKLLCLFDSRASVYHIVTPERMTLEYFWQRNFNQGISASYTMLRNGSQTKKSRRCGAVAFARFVANGVWRRVKRWVGEDAEFCKLAKVISDGYRQGFEYHQRMYQTDMEVRAWVHKSDYFEEV